MKDDGSLVRLLSRGTLIVRLEVTPGTGYGWQIIQNDERYLKLAGPSTFEKQKDSRLGARAYEVFRFRAQAAGFTKLELHYKRPWEKKAPPL